MGRTLALMLAGAALATATTALADDARAALDRFAEGLVALEGRFEQRVYNGDGSLREEASGSLALKAPRLFRWEYETPYEQLVVADGSHVWLYDVDLEQVTVRRQADEEAQSPLVVLTDPDSLDQRYRVIDIGRRDDLDWLRLEPLDPDSGFSFAELGLDDDGLRRMHMEDSLGGTTEIEYGHWRRNPLMAPDRFDFTPPDGVDLVGDVDSVAELHPLSDD